jgi:hypothetical protein
LLLFSGERGNVPNDTLLLIIIIIILIVIIIRKTALFEPLPSLEDSARFVVNYVIRFPLV